MSPRDACVSRHLTRSRTKVALVLLAVATVVVMTTPAQHRASAAQDETVTLRQPQPLPGSLVPDGAVEVAVDVIGGTVGSASILVDGVTAPLATGPGEARVASQPVEVGAGPHEVRVLVETSSGHEVDRTWRFTATRVRTERLAGPDRVATSIAIARDQAGDAAAPAAVLARADEFADALAGAPLAASVGGPLLLTGRDGLAPDVAEALGDLVRDDGVVHLLGGPSALSAQVRQDVEALGLQTRRHAGDDRYDTAAQIAAAFPGASDVVVASGVSFPDALAASVPAARDGRPILLVGPDHLPDATRDVLVDLDPAAIVVGGAAVVSDDVLDELRAHAAGVERVAGSDRYATAAAVMDRWYPTDAASPTQVALADGTNFPDALAATHHAAAAGAPLLLVDGGMLPDATDLALRGRRPGNLVVYGGKGAVPTDAVRAAVGAATDGPGAARLVHQQPATGTTTRGLPAVEMAFDAAVDAASLQLHVLLDDDELPVEVAARETSDGVSATVQLPTGLELEYPYPVRITASVAAPSGLTSHLDWSSTLQLHDPVFATVGPVELTEPSAAVEFIGYHQSSHEGARQLDPNPRTSTPSMTMESRGRGTGLRTSADLVADEDVEVVAPVTGTVLRAGTYRLYCDHSDHYLVIEPDTRPGWEVKLLHFRGLQVAAGDRVIAGVTVVGDGPRILPFESQVDEHSSSGHGPHLHVEVVDPSIPNVGGGSC